MIWTQTGFPYVFDYSIDSMDNIYACGTFQGSSFSLGGFKIIGKGNDDAFIVKLDSTGKVLWLKSEGGKDDDGALGIKCFPDGRFYLVGYFRNIATFSGRTIGEKSKNSYNVEWGFTAFYSKDGILKWIQKEGVNPGNTGAYSVAFHNQFAYIGGNYLSCSPLFGKTKLPYFYGSCISIAKMDSNGSFLWAYGGGGSSVSTTRNIATDTSGSSFCIGDLGGSADFGKFTLKLIGLWDAFFLKITDVSLWRDKIIKTKYCTGDSILVPYHVSGIIGPGNTFHAELSDSNGSFDSVYYPIGKLTTQGNGIIHCKLPDSLPYSSRYNIHLYSDTPNVTSYFNPQTISIYPYPLVKASGDSSVCFGQKDTLHASGASTYLWFPDTALINAKTPSPVFKADTTRSYSVIGYNVAGCADTAKITIHVSPKISIKTSRDTIICFGTSASLRARASGGNDTNYSYTWYQGVTKIASGATFTVAPARTTTYHVIVSDGCSSAETDSVKVTVEKFLPLKVFASNSQGICPGHPNHLTSFGIGGDSTKYVFSWDTNGTNIHVGATLAVAPVSTTIYRVILHDTGLCPQKPDTGFVTVYRTAPMKLSTHDTTICYGSPATISARGTGGDSLRYIYSWDTGGVFISNRATASVAPTGTQIYRCILTDSCSLHSDTAYVKVTVSPPLKLKLSNDTIICLGRSVLLSALGSGGIGDTSKYIYQWDSGGIIFATRATTRVAPTNTTKYRCIINDGCSSADTGFVNVSVRSKLSVRANNVSVCKGDSVRIIAQGSGGDSIHYIYKWNNGAVVPNHIGIVVALDSTRQFTVVLKDNCSLDSAIANATVTVNPNPKSILNISPKELEIRTGEIYFTALNTDADSFLWLFGDSTGGKGVNETHSYQTDGTFSPKLISTNQYGCRDTATGEVVILPQLQVYFPNVFTPDGDSLNETWMPIGIGISKISITIYDRWGGHVFKSESLTRGWNGNILNSNDPAIPGVYPYIVNFWDYNGNKHTKTGTILLLITSKY